MTPFYFHGYLAPANSGMQEGRARQPIFFLYEVPPKHAAQQAPQRPQERPFATTTTRPRYGADHSEPGPCGGAKDSLPHLVALWTRLRKVPRGEHARLARALGLHSLIVVINKMDCVEYGEERFRFVVDALQNFLIDDVGFSQGQLTFVPVSGIEGTNISPDDAAALPDALASWYRGPTLVDALRAVKIPSRGAPKPLRMPIADIITEVRSLGGAACGGKIEAGSLMKGQKLLVMPANVSATVKCVEVDGIAVDFAPIGTSVDVGLSDVDSRHLEVGSVLCHASHPITPTDEIEVRVLTTDMLRVPLLKGSKVVLHSHMLACDATIEELVAQVDTVTGDVVKASPRCITREQSAILRIRTSRNICVEPVEISPTLSRVTLRMNGKTMALGVVTAIWRS